MASPPTTTAVLDIAGLELPYVEAGTGSALICLHDETPGASARDFERNLPELAQRFHTVLLDLPARPTADAGLELVLQALDALDLARVDLLGNGLGGEIALRLAVAAPERVRKLVVAGPSGCLFSPFTPPPLEGAKAIERYWREPKPEVLREAIRLSLFDQSFNTDDEILRRHRQAMSGRAAVRSASEIQAIGDLTLIAHLVQAPALIVWGREDRLSPIDFGLNLLSRIPDAQFHMFPECGHWPQTEKAAEFNALVLDFLTFDNRMAPGKGTGV